MDKVAGRSSNEHLKQSQRATMHEDLRRQEMESTRMLQGRPELCLWAAELSGLYIGTSGQKSESEATY